MCVVADYILSNVFPKMLIYCCLFTQFLCLVVAFFSLFVASNYCVMPNIFLNHGVHEAFALATMMSGENDS